MKEKVYIVVSEWYYEKSGGSDKNINYVTKSIDVAIEKKNHIAKEELLNNSYMWKEEKIFNKEERSDYFFIINNNGDWFEVEIIEKEID